MPLPSVDEILNGKKPKKQEKGQTSTRPGGRLPTPAEILQGASTKNLPAPTIAPVKAKVAQYEPSFGEKALGFFERLGESSKDPFTRLGNRAGAYLGGKVNELLFDITPQQTEQLLTKAKSPMVARMNSLSPTTQKVADFSGNIAGSIVGLGMAGKVAGPIANRVVGGLGKPILNDIAAQAGTGLLYEGVNAAADGNSPAEIAKRAGEGALLFGAAGPLGSVVGKKVASLLPEAAGHYAGNLAKGATTGLGFSYGGNLLEGQPLDNANAAKNAAAFAALDLLLGGKAKVNTNTLEPQLKPNIGANREPILPKELNSNPQVTQILSDSPWNITRNEFENNYVLHGAGNTASKLIDLEGKITKGYYTYGNRPDIATMYTSDSGLVKTGDPSGNIYYSNTPIKNDWEITHDAMGISSNMPLEITGKVPGNVDPHKYLVEKAIAEGKQVPKKVLLDYQDILIPKSNFIISESPLPKERGFAQNVKVSSVATADIKQNLKNNALTYDPITNKDTFDKATQLVKDDVNTAMEQFNTPNKKLSADDVAVGEALIVKSIKEGNSSEANRLIADLAEKLTTAGQAIQAASVFKKFTPEGMLLYAQRMINRANRESIDKMGKKAKKIVLTSEDSEFIIQNMKEAQALPDGRDKDIAIAKVMQLIADKMPVTRGEKLKAVQRIALLLNPRTMTRNVVGNTLFSAVDNLSNVVATPFDKAVGKLTGQRTTTLPSLTGQLKSGLQGAKETIEDARLGIDTSPSRSQYDLPEKTIFKGEDLFNNTLNKLDKATKLGLQLGDRPFYKAAYNDSLRQQMKLAKVSEPTQVMIEQAHKIAQQRTYQDTNALTEAFKIAQRALNKTSGFVGLGNEEFGLGNLVIPFVKTPANILARAIEYTPIGVTKALKEATNIGKGKFNQKAFVDAISRSVTGTAIIMVGYDLAKRGVITGSGNDDKDVAAFERSIGKSDYAYKVGDRYYTYDWAQPASMALAIGADMYLKGKSRKDAENVVFDAVKSGGETLFKQSVMQGIQRFMGGFSPIDNLETTALNAPTMFMPTILRQINQLTDDTQRNTYSPTKIGTAWNIVKSKVPGLSQTLEPKIDTFGNTTKTLQGKNNLFNVLINPGTTTEFKPTKAQKELVRLYDTTGDKDIFPKLAPRYFTVKGQRYNLTPQEITKFQQTMGKKTEQKLNHIADSSYSDEAKIKQIKKAIEKAYEDAKKEAVRNRKE